MAVNQYFLDNPVRAAFAVIEHFDALKKIMPLHYHIKAAEFMMENSLIDNAYMALSPVMEPSNEKGVLKERALSLFIKNADNWVKRRKL